MPGRDGMTSYDEIINVPDRFTHIYVACENSVCILCAAYDAGYSAGKVKAYFGVRNWHPKQHAPFCGCNPRMAARSALSKGTL